MEFISITAAAEVKNCGRNTLYRAADDGRVNTREVAGRRLIVADEKFEQFKPQFTGARAARQKDSTDS